jgi:hypothetical protein
MKKETWQLIASKGIQALFAFMLPTVALWVYNWVNYHPFYLFVWPKFFIKWNKILYHGDRLDLLFLITVNILCLFMYLPAILAPNFFKK